MSKESAAPAQKGAPKGTGPALPSMKRGLKGFIQDLQREMKNVTWPTPQEATRLTGVVLGVCAGIIAFLFVISFVVEQAIKIIIQTGGN
jgi:preprotein translocase SecE subunit